MLAQFVRVWLSRLASPPTPLALPQPRRAAPSELDRRGGSNFRPRAPAPSTRAPTGSSRSSGAVLAPSRAKALPCNVRALRVYACRT